MIRAYSEPSEGNAPIGNCEGSDVQQLRAVLLTLLPLHVTLRCHQEFTPRPVHVTSDRTVWLALRRRKAVVFGIEEWHTLVAAFRDDRCNPVVLAEWCETKAKWPQWKVTLAVALGGVSQSALAGDDASVGAVLAGWGLQLASIHYGAEVPA